MISLCKKLFVLFLATRIVSAKVILLMAEEYEDCSEGDKFMDYSELEYEYANDTSFLLNGKQPKLTVWIF